MNKVDSLIKGVRRAISEIAENFESETKYLIEFLGVLDEHAYNSVIDSFYLLEDTQLAKHDFSEVDFINESFGRLYLMFYGVLNACYMQQQALLVICQKLEISDNLDEIKGVQIVAFRNDFSAHSANRGRGNAQHSFILDRFGMKEGKVKGYTANHKLGVVFREADINSLISSWDIILEQQMKLISDRVLKRETA